MSPEFGDRTGGASFEDRTGVTWDREAGAEPSDDTFEEFIARSESEKVFLAEVQVARKYDGFYLAEGMASTYEYPQRAIANGGFETLGTGVHPDIFADWTEAVTGTGVVAAGVAYAGSWSLSLGSGAAAGDAWASMQIVLPANKFYKLSFNYKKSVALPYASFFCYIHTPDVYYNFVTMEWSDVPQDYHYLGDSTAWVKQSLIIRSHPTRSTNVVIGFKLYGATAGNNQTVLIDDVYIVETESQEMADGTMEEIHKTIDRVEINGVAMTVQGTIAATEADPGSFYWDDVNKILYVHCADSLSPNNDTVIAYFWLYFATKGLILNSRYYEPYIADNGIPAIDQAISEIRYGTANIGSGSVTFANGRGYFDQIAKSFIWTNKKVRILLGGDDLAYAEYVPIFTGRIIQTRFTETEFVIDTRSSSYDLLRELPINNYWTSTYPNLDPAAEGFSIPYFWGSYSEDQAPLATCIDTASGVNTYQFKICDTTFHAISSITQVYIDYGDGAGWQTIVHASENLATATFTITSATFVLGISRVKVAFEGYTDGALIEGAPEIVEDLLLNQCGYSADDLEPLSFAESKTESVFVLNVPVIDSISAMSVIEQICASDLAYFDEDGEGKLRYRTYSPSADLASLPTVDTTDIIGMPEIWEDYDQLYYRVKVGYSYNPITTYYLYAEETDYTSLYKYGKNEILNVKSYLRSKANADDLCAKLSIVTRELVSQIRLKLKTSQITTLLGDQIKVTLPRAPSATPGGYDERVFEIKSTRLSCFPLEFEVTGRDSVEFAFDVGVWMGATAPDWADATQAEKDSSGFWTDADGYCDTADLSSLNKSRWW